MNEMTMDPAQIPAQPVRVLIADDQRVVRDGLCLVVGLLDDVEVVGTASDGAQAVTMAEDLQPDVVLMDLHMPVLDGAQATRRIRTSQPHTQILVLSTYADDNDLLPALEAGALGYLTKDASAEAIHRALIDVAHGRTHLDPAIQQRLVTRALHRNAGTSITPTSPVTDPAAESAAELSVPPDGLTTRELEVLQLIARGLSNTEIARTLVVSDATIKTHINHIFAKTGARDRGQAVRYAYQHNLHTP